MKIFSAVVNMVILTKIRVYVMQHKSDGQHEVCMTKKLL